MLATARAHGSGEARQWWHRQWAAQTRGGGGLWCVGGVSDMAPTYDCGQGYVQMVARVCWGSAR